jgi:hypothetical protein
MSRRSGSKMGVFTQSQFDALQGIATRCKNKLALMRTRGIKVEKEELLSVFVKEEHHELLTKAGALCTSYSQQQELVAGTTGAYENAFIAHATYGLKLRAITSNLSFVVPDYATRRLYRDALLDRKLPVNLQKFVDVRLALALEFGLLNEFLQWFASERLTVPQMAYLFPPIINMLSESPVTKKLADQYGKPAVPSVMPTPPGRREAFSLVESTLLKALMLPDDAHVESAAVHLDVEFISPVRFMNWEIELLA